MTKHTTHKIISVTMVVLAAITLFLAQSAYWINHTVFNEQNFSNTITSTILTETNRDAIATSVVNQALADRPVAMRLVGDRAIALTSGLLGTDLSSQLIATLTSKTYAYTTSSDRQDIAVDLTAIKAPISTLVTLADQAGRDVNVSVDQIPDEIVLLKSESFPDLSGAVKTMLWLGPLLWLSTIVLFASYIYIGRKNYAKRVYVVGFTIAGIAILGLATAPFIPAPLAAAVPTITLRPVAESLAVAFLAPFKNQMWYMLGISLVALAIFSLRFSILKVTKAATESLSNKLAKKPTTKN